MLQSQDLVGVSIALSEFVHQALNCEVTENSRDNIRLWCDSPISRAQAAQRIDLVNGLQLANDERIAELVQAMEDKRRVVVLDANTRDELIISEPRFRAVAASIDRQFVHTGPGGMDYKVVQPRP